MDNQCLGDTGDGLVDELLTDSGFHNPGNADEYSWTVQPGATEYQVARSDVPDFSGACVLFTTSATFHVDTPDPALGGIFYYLSRALAPNAGSWGANSAGANRPVLCVP